MANDNAVRLTSLFLPDLDLRDYSATNYQSFVPYARVSTDPGTIASVVLTLDQPLDLKDTGLTSTLTIRGTSSYLDVLGDTALGNYHVTSAIVTDVNGAIVSYDAAALAAANISSAFTIGRSDVGGDQERPELDSLTLPTNVVTGPGGVSTNFQLSAYDDGGSGLASGTITLDRPLQTANGPVSTLALNDHVYIGTVGATIAITSGTASGVYHAVAATVTDGAGNTRIYNAADLSYYTPFTIDDKTVPTLTSLHIPTVDVTKHDESLNLSATVDDAASNATSVELTLDKPLTEVGYSGHGVHFTSQISTVTLSASSGGNESFASANFDVDLTTATGTYTVVQAVVSDAAGNSTTYSNADLAKLGFDTTMTVKADSTPPVLTSLTLPSFTGGEPSTGIISVGATDASPSNGYLYAVVNLDHPIATSGYAGVYVNQDARSLLQGPSAAFASGTTSSATVTPDAAQSPSYNVTSIALIDRSGNEVDYSAAQLQQMGFSTHFVTNTAALFTAIAAAETLVAPTSGHAYFQGDASGASMVVLNGNVADYTMSRLQPSSGGGSQVGAFVLTATNGSGRYTIEQSVGSVRFQNGQSLSLHDLPAYVYGVSDLAYGGAGHDDFIQHPGITYQPFVGGGGLDDVYLTGNTRDYTLRHFDGDMATGQFGPSPSVHISGLELVAKNGSGTLLIDQSIETIHFQDGQYLSFGDVSAYVAADPQSSESHLAIAPDDPTSRAQDFTNLPGARVLVDGNVGDYSLSRSYDGNFDLTHTDASRQTITLGQTIASVQFANGQFLAPQDLSSQISGDDTMTAGRSGDDLLKVAASGDQFVTGGDGTDNLYLHGNAQDYELAAVKQDYDPHTGNPAIDGYELIAKNGSGNIYIDGSVETIHFQNGQSSSFSDLPSTIVISGGLPFGTDGNDVLFQNLHEAYQLFVGDGAVDDVYLNGNAGDYTLRLFEGGTAALPSAHLASKAVSGLELVAQNGSGALLIDSSVETIHFENGQYLSYADVGAYVAADPQQSQDHIGIAPEGGSAIPQIFAASGDRVLLNGNVGDYSVSRASDGAFVLSPAGGADAAITLGQAIGGVQFANGQTLALQELSSHTVGSDIFTLGTSGDDILTVGFAGDQYVTGGDGTDALYIHGNTQDYTVATVSQDAGASTGHPAINGYELVALNGSGNIYIDSSVEALHLQNGQMTQVHDLAAFFAEHHV